MLQEKSGAKPFAFLYDGKPADLADIHGRVIRESDEQCKLIYDFIPGVVRVILDVIEYKDFPVIEYTPYLENTGHEPSGILSDFLSLDMEAEDPLTFGEQKLKESRSFASGRISVRYNLGSNASGVDFLPQRRDLFSRPGSNKLELECKGAWCSTDYLPFFGVDTDPMNGVNIGIGWNGGWKFSVEKEAGVPGLNGGKKSHLRGGMKRSHFRLLPGEKLMQPGVLLHFREAKSIRDGQNEFRRFMLAHHAPRDSRGQLLKPPMCFCTWGGFESELQIPLCRLIQEKRLPYESLWMDAGWMGKDAPCPHFLEESDVRSDWHQRVGSWTINRHAHPKGLRPLSNAIHQAGMRFLVWFETQRICSLSRSSLLTEHPDWLIGDWQAVREGKSVNLLLNLGIPEARKYLTELVTGILEKEGIDDYREDFNMDAWPFWCSGDSPDRIGVTEMNYVEGFYLFWTSVRKHFPDSFIDNCSGGGRRLDYKTASLSFPMCQSDYACYSTYEEECITFENMFLDDWLPLHGTLNWGEEDPYHAACAFGGGYGSKVWQYHGREPKPDHDYGYHRKLLTWGKRLRDAHLLGDVYPLIDSPELDMRKWNALQTHIPERNEGFIQIFRRKQSPESRQILHLERICPDAEYTVEYFTGGKEIMRGCELMQLSITLPAPRSFEIMHYIGG
jgi:alpha-galactosidase